jgi:hypothetical protein
MKEDLKMPAGDMLVDESLWRKPRRSVGNGACVEVTVAEPGIATRDSTDQAGPRVTFSAAAWHNFGQSVRQGQFNI